MLDDLHVDVPPGHGHDQENEETRMIGDFNSSASALWSLYGREAKSHDESRIQTLKEDMDGVLIFVRSFLYILVMPSMLNQSTTGRSIFRCSYCVHNRQQTELESQSR